jgi:hypothetical protein
MKRADLNTVKSYFKFFNAEFSALAWVLAWHFFDKKDWVTSACMVAFALLFNFYYWKYENAQVKKIGALERELGV